MERNKKLLSYFLQATPPSKADDCPSIEKIIDYQNNRLPEEEAKQIQKHLDHCESCSLVGMQYLIWEKDMKRISPPIPRFSRKSVFEKSGRYFFFTNYTFASGAVFSVLILFGLFFLLLKSPETDHSNDMRKHDIVRGMDHESVDARNEKNQSGEIIEESPLHKYALIIGVNQYEDPKLHGLKYAVDDALAIRNMLVSPNVGFLEKNITLLISGEPLFKPTRTMILRYLEDYLLRAAPNETIFIYFAGHGRGQYLLPEDANVQLIEETGIHIEKDLQARLIQSRARRKIVILDACETGSLSSRAAGDPPDLKKLFAEAKGTALLASCNSDQDSHESPEFKHGVFTHFLLRGIQGAANDPSQNPLAIQDSFITLNEVKDYAWREVRDWGRRAGYEQTPTADLKQSGPFLLAHANILSQLLVTTIPSHAQVQLRKDGKTVPAGRQIEAGKYEVTVSAEGYEPQTQIIEIKPGESKTIEIRLKIEISTSAPDEVKKPPIETKQQFNELIVPLNDDIEIVFVPIPAPLDDPDSPIRSDFYIGKYEVTQKQWEFVMGYNPSDTLHPNAPVENVSWNDCQKFIEKLNSLVPDTFRLPTDTEWEYAARAGTKGKYYWNDEPQSSKLDEYVWYRNNSNGQSHPVGKKKPNLWGLYDVIGNVREWVSDGPDDSRFYFRGGCWDDTFRDASILFKEAQPSDYAWRDIGFRLVVEKPHEEITNPSRN